MNVTGILLENLKDGHNLKQQTQLLVGSTQIALLQIVGSCKGVRKKLISPKSN